MEQVLTNKEEWISTRTGGIGGSEVAAILGLDPYKSPYKVWLEKVTGISNHVENEYTISGNRLEKVVVEYFYDETGFSISPQEEIQFHTVIHPIYEYMKGSRDREYFNSEGKRCILECKTTQKEIDPENLPMTWFCQLQWYMGLYDVPEGCIAWLERGVKFRYKVIEFNQGFYNYLVQNVRIFWENHVLTKVEPPLMNGSDAAFRYPNHEDGKSIEAPDELFAVYNQLMDVRQKISALEEQEKALLDQFKLVMKDAEKCTYAGMTLATWKTDKPKMSFDSKKFEMENKDLYKTYCFQKEGIRRFLIK